VAGAVSAAVRGLPRRGARLPAPCEHQQGLHQHGASIMQRKPLPSGGIRADKAAPRPVRDDAERTQALRQNLVATASNLRTLLLPFTSRVPS
jgi:hypothetical protein